MTRHTNVSLVKIPRIPDARGNISFLQNLEQVPFVIRKICWINDIPSGSERAGRASLVATEMVISLSGSFEVLTHNGTEACTYMLNRPDECLLIPKGHWRQFRNFSTNSIVLTLSDVPDEQEQVIEDFPTFEALLPDAN